MNTSDQKQLKDALKYALSILEDQANKGLYPEAALVENGGKGFAPITKALEKIESLPDDTLQFLTKEADTFIRVEINKIIYNGLKIRGYMMGSSLEFLKKNKLSCTETSNKIFFRVNGSLFCEITLGDVTMNISLSKHTISRGFTYKYYE